MKRILAIKREDGGVSITNLSHITEAEIEKAILLATHSVKFDKEGNIIYTKFPHFISWRLVDEKDIPQDRELRNAWTDDFETETVDIRNSTAKDIQLKRLRKAREEALIDLDLQYKIAERNGDINSIGDLNLRRKKLLDITDNLKKLNISDDNSLELLNQIKTFGNITTVYE